MRKFVFISVCFFLSSCTTSNKGIQMHNELMNYKLVLIHEYENDNGDGSVDEKKLIVKTIYPQSISVVTKKEWDLLTTPKQEEVSIELVIAKKDALALQNLLTNLSILESGEYGSDDYVNDEGIDQNNLDLEINGTSRKYNLIHSHLNDPTLPKDLTKVLHFIQKLTSK